MNKDRTYSVEMHRVTALIVAQRHRELYQSVGRDGDDVTVDGE